MEILMLVISFVTLFIVYKNKTKTYVNLNTGDLLKDVGFIFIVTMFITILINLVFTYIATKIDFGNYIYIVRVIPLIIFIILTLITVKFKLKSKISDKNNLKNVSGNVVGTYILFLILLSIIVAIFFK